MHAEVHRPSAAVEMSYVQFLLFYLIMRLQIMGRRFADLEKILKADETSEAWIVDYNNVVWKNLCMSIIWSSNSTVIGAFKFAHRQESDSE